MRKNEGFTIVELILVISVLVILAAIVVPRFSKSIVSARGGQVLANMYTCEAAVNLYFTKNATFPDNTNNLVGAYLASWPKPPIGKALVKKHDNSELMLAIEATSYVYVKPATGSELNTRIGRVTLGGMTIDDILSTSESSLTLTDG